MKTLEIKLAPVVGKGCAVLLDGVDQSQHISDITIHAHANEPTSATIEFGMVNVVSELTKESGKVNIAHLDELREVLAPFGYEVVKKPD